MVTKKSVKGSKKSKASKKSKGEAARRFARLAPTQDPIIITGGSLFMDCAAGLDDGFNETVSGGKRRLAHKQNATGRVQLTKIEIFSPAPPPNSPPPALPAPMMTIDLKALGVNRRCQIRVHYDF